MDRWIDVGSSGVIISEFIFLYMYAIEVDGGDEEGGDLKGTQSLWSFLYTLFFFISFMCACLCNL